MNIPNPSSALDSNDLECCFPLGSQKEPRVSSCGRSVFTERSLFCAQSVNANDFSKVWARQMKYFNQAVRNHSSSLLRAISCCFQRLSTTSTTTCADALEYSSKVRSRFPFVDDKWGEGSLTTTSNNSIILLS